MIRQRIETLITYIIKEKHLYGKSALIFLIQVLGVIIAFVANLIVVRIFGEEIYGVYANVSNWMFFFVMICGWALDDYFVARLPVLWTQHKFRLINKLFFDATATVLLTWLVVSLVILVFHTIFTRLFHIEYYMLWLVCAAVVTLSLYTMLIAFLRGLNNVTIGQLAERVVRPVLLLGFVGVFYLYGNYRHIQYLLWIWVLNFSVLTVACAVVIYKKFSFINLFTYIGRVRLLHKASLYFFINTVFSTLAVRADIYILSLLRPPVMIGYYNIAQKYADVVLYPIMVINLLIPATLSTFNYLNERKKVFDLIKNGSLIMLSGTTVLFILTAIAGKYLFMLYGKNFMVAFPAYLFIAGSHFFTAFTGPVNAFILVSGRERYALRMTMLHAVATAVFCYIGITYKGLTGAAIGSFCGTLVYCTILNIYFYRTYHAVITPFKVLYFNK